LDLGALDRLGPGTVQVSAMLLNEIGNTYAVEQLGQSSTLSSLGRRPHIDERRLATISRRGWAPRRRQLARTAGLNSPDTSNLGQLETDSGTGGSVAVP
jgi:hypothetical protein